MTTADGARRLRECNVVVALSTLTRGTGGTGAERVLKSESKSSGERPTEIKVVGPLFSTKSEMLTKTRAGEFLAHGVFGGEAGKRFSSSILAVLRNDYGVPPLPTDSACQSEFSAHVGSLFGAVAEKHASSLGALPPEFRAPVSPGLARGAEQALQQIRETGNGWCRGPGGPHPYAAALPRLASEFEPAVASSVEQARTQKQSAYQKAKEDALNQQQDAARRAKDIESQRQASEIATAQHKQKVASTRAEHEAGAGSRNAAKIKALGLASRLESSTIFVNFLGRWTAFSTFDRWLGLVLENRKISTVRATSWRGYPGVSILVGNQAPISVFFRMEGNGAYLHAVGSGPNVEILHSASEHSQMSNFMSVMTDENAMP